MNRKLIIILLAILALLLVVGCNTDESSQDVEAETTSKDVLYKNATYDIVVEKNDDWELKSDANTDNLNVILRNGKSQAIISSVSSDRKFAAVKKELKASTKNIKIISEDNNRLSYQSTLEDAILTDVYFKEHNSSINLIIIFMSPESAYEQAKPSVKSLLKHIKQL
ncbi:hypothetical protein [Paraliobacillus salinarum]|uniref:hypothetical protein n=1 Tax=Paraliobacillus salinarum TaxID=1158996 RepID=UPI0015F40879|nr:hypothetical protein [Paraliobacillus salinarum]